MTITTDRAPRALLHDAEQAAPAERVRLQLLACGVIYGLLYVVVNDVLAAAAYDGYSRSSQAISELSAAGAPTQPMLAALVPVFSALLIAFGIGVWKSAGDHRSLRVTGSLLVLHGATALLWLLAPMSQRELLATQGGGGSDTLHLALSVASAILIFAQIGSSAAAFGRSFRVYALVSVVAILVAGVVTAALSVRLAAGEPTPWLGLAERVSLGGWLVWMAVLAIALAVRKPATSQAVSP